MIDDIYKRAKVLSKACIKISLVLPGDNGMSIVIRSNLIQAASQMTIKCKGLMSTQVQDYFLKNVMDAKEQADACSYWLEMVNEEQFIDSTIIEPILAESIELSKLFTLAMRKVKPNAF